MKLLLTILPFWILLSPASAGGRLDAGSVSSGAAYKIADALFNANMGCGFVEGHLRDEGSRWAFTARIGYAGTVDPNPILVDKQTGAASWASLEQIEGQRGP